MFYKSAHLYDAVYLNMGKDYAREAALVHDLILKHKKSRGDHLLDIGCGTGLHLSHLNNDFQVEGLDIDTNMLKAAKKKYPDIPFHVGDMRGFSLDHKFDAIICLFSAIGYVRTIRLLNQTLTVIARHLVPGGVLIVEPWLSPEDWKTGKIHGLFVDQPDLKIARMNNSTRKGRISSFTFHYLVGTPRGIEHFTELHELGLFTKDEYLRSFQHAGLTVEHDPVGLDGRGLYIGNKAMD